MRITSLSTGTPVPQAYVFISAALRLSLMNHSWTIGHSLLENWTVPFSLMHSNRAGYNRELHLRSVESKVLPAGATRPLWIQVQSPQRANSISWQSRPMLRSFVGRARVLDSLDLSLGADKLSMGHAPPPGALDERIVAKSRQ